MKKIYLCSDTITGLFSAIYDAWETGRREEECGIAFRESMEQELFCEYYETQETEKKARAVESMIKRHLGRRVYWDIYHAALSGDRRKGDAILGTMLAARQIPDSTRIMEHLSHPQVERVFELSRNVGGEAHSYKGFLRFKELENGVLYSEITPKNQVLTCLAPHFADRLPLENWMIYDKTHRMFVVHEAGKKWVLIWDEGIDRSFASRESEQELLYARLWKSFCRTIAIESRTNPKCQLSHLPLRYRGDMLEHM
ncbi:TIGR03915 family putative DNA repair protein [Lachnospiraceae bacterium 48-42]|nr:DNA metabolism protein [Dorea sp.]